MITLLSILGIVQNTPYVYKKNVRKGQISKIIYFFSRETVKEAVKITMNFLKTLDFVQLQICLKPVVLYVTAINENR